MYPSYKKVTLLLISFIAILLFGCGNNYVMDDDDDISFSDGILYMSLSYREGTNILNNITFTMETANNSYRYQITLKPNTQKTILLPLKAGQYYFSKISGESDSGFVTPKKQTTNYLHGNMYENVFEIKPGKINYIGNILVQVNLSRIGKMFKLSAPNSPTVNKAFYFFSSHLDKDIKKLKSKFPKLTNKYPTIKHKIIFGIKSAEIKNKYTKQQFSYGYGGESYGKDPQGYNNYKWGMTLDEIKLLLKSENKKYSIINKNRILDNTIKTNPINLYFSKTGIPEWEGKLYKISLSFNKDIGTIKESTTKKYGFPTKQGKKWIWRLSKSFIVLEGKDDNKCTLTYYSKGYKALMG
jgi:hypothetical protein